MAKGFPVDTNSLDTILRTEGAFVGTSIGEYSNTPVLGTVMLAQTFISGGTFSIHLQDLYLESNTDIRVLLNVRLANGFVSGSTDLDAATLTYIDLKAGIPFVYKANRMLLYNQVLQFIFQTFGSGTSSAIKFRVSYDGRRMIMNRNPYAPFAAKFIGDSITAGANSATTNDKPYGSWATRITYDHFGITYDIKAINKGVGGTTAYGMNQACLTGWSYVPNANIVFIALGTNPDTTDELFTTGINGILDRELIYHPGAWFIICAPIVKDNAGEAQNIIYRGLLQAIVTERSNAKILYLPFDSLGILPGVIPSDVHPNQAGHDAMYEYVSAFLTENGVTL